MTVVERMVAAGIARHRAEAHIRYDRVRVDGVAVVSPDHPAAPPARVVLRSPHQEIP